MSSSNEYPDLTTFKALSYLAARKSSFDVYGTLIDWESGMLGALRVLISEQLPPAHPLNADPPREALARLAAITRELERARGALPYDEVLAQAVAQLASEAGAALPDGAAADFGRSPGTWGPFADTVAGLRKLARRYRLIALSNVDNANIRATVGRQLAPARFDAVYTAQDIGSYKPSRANFEYLFERARRDLGIDWEKGELLHVAHSLRADHVPAKELGLRSVWISRGGEREGKHSVGGDYGKLREKTAFEWRFDTIGDFADEVERQFAAKEKA